ncbi:MAG: hypothetical protein ACI85O_001545 [Saprospiraceae bacterium]|jgi:hypothetical protein
MKIYLTSFFLLLFSFSAFSQSALSGKVVDADTGEPILFGDVVVYRNGALVTGEQTDFDGNYIISPMDSGKYSIVFKYVGYGDVKIEKVVVRKNKETNLNAEMSSGITLETTSVRSCGVPLVAQDYSTHGISLTSEDIVNLPYKDINGIIRQRPNTNMTETMDRIKKVKEEENLPSEVSTLETAIIKAYKTPMVQPDVCSQGIGFKFENVKLRPSKNINGIISQASGCGSAKKKQLEIKSMYDEKPDDYLENLAVKNQKVLVTKIKTKDEVENTQLDVKVFPNPVSDILEVSLPKSEMTAKLFNLSGQLVLTLIKDDNRLDVSALPAGNYFLEIADGKIVQTERIVIIRD